MIFGEHLSADEVAVRCSCGVIASVEVIDQAGCSRGWFCRRHAARARDTVHRENALARAIVRGRP